MRKALRTVITCIYLLLIGTLGFAFAQGKVTVDPNTMPKTDQAGTDQRLEQKVTLEAATSKLADVLDQLSKQSGVYIHAGASQQDWRVREQRITLKATDVALGTVLDNLSTVLRFRLSTGTKDGKTTYLFWQDHNQRSAESAMLSTQTEMQAQRSVAARQAALDDAREALNMTPEQAKALEESDPWMSYLGGTEGGKAVAQMLNQLSGSDDFRELMLRGKDARLDLADASPELRQTAEKVMQASGKLAGQQGGDYMNAFSPAYIVSMPLAEGESTNAGTGMGGMLMVMAKPKDPGKASPDAPMFADGFPAAVIPITGKGTVMGGLFGKMYLAIESGKAKNMMEAIQQAGMDSDKNRKAMMDLLAYPSKTEANPPQDPALRREVEWPDETMDVGTNYTDRHASEAKSVTTLSQVLGMPVAAETYDGVMMIANMITKGKQPAYQLLVACEKAGYDWQISKGSLLLKPKDWALQRSWMVPGALVEHYRALLKKNSTLSLDELAQITVELTDGQIQHGLITDEELMPALMPIMSGMQMFGSVSALRFYGTLSGTQKQALRSTAGLQFASLSPEQYDKLLNLSAGRWGGAEITGGIITAKSIAKNATKTIVGDKPAAKADKPKEEDKSEAISFEFKAQVASASGNEPETRAFSANIMLPDKASIAAMKQAFEGAKKQMAEQMEKAKKDAKAAGDDKQPKAAPAPAAPAAGTSQKAN